MYCFLAEIYKLYMRKIDLLTFFNSYVKENTLLIVLCSYMCVLKRILHYIMIIKFLVVVVEGLGQLPAPPRNSNTLFPNIYINECSITIY